MSGHYVYRIWDADDRLIWIGATSHLEARIAEHKRTRAWPGSHKSLWVGARMARWDAVEYPTRKEAWAAEKVAIATEHPELNTNHRCPA